MEWYLKPFLVLALKTEIHILIDQILLPKFLMFSLLWLAAFIANVYLQSYLFFGSYASWFLIMSVQGIF